MARLSLVAASCLLTIQPAASSAQEPTPLRQSTLTRETAGPPRPFQLDDAARDDRWLGLDVKDARWSIDGSAVFFRWNRTPAPGQYPEGDPWFVTTRDGRTARPARPDELVPDRHPSWSADGKVAAWTSGGSLVVADGAGPRKVLTIGRPLGPALTSADGASVQFSMGEDQYRFEVATSSLRQLTRKHVLPAPLGSGAKWLATEQPQLFGRVRDSLGRRQASELRGRGDLAPQAIPVMAGVRLEDVQLSPDQRYLSFVAVTPANPPSTTSYMDYVTASGQATALSARGKIDGPQDRRRLGIVRIDPTIPPDSVRVTWVDLDAAGGRDVMPSGLSWSVEGDRAVAQFLSTDWHDNWIAEVDPSTGRATPIAHDHDDAWLGGPPIQAVRSSPALLEWLPGGRVVFGSERTGWSHLYLIEPDRRIRALTSGNWELRAAELSRDRTTWLLGAGRENASDDDLYLMPAAGGELKRITSKTGRSVGALSPDGKRVAVIFGDAVSLPDLYLRDAAPDSPEQRVTSSGTDEYFRHRLVRPKVVAFTHPDGKPVYGSIYTPVKPNAERAAVVHIHGGGYRHFTHNGWSVYGYGNHLGLIHRLLEQGYTVLDFDYRGGAGYGRDYRTDIYQSMGQKDIDGVLPAIDYLVKEHGVDRRRIGVYGVSYGGFFTLMALFRHPGVFAAGIANAAVTDWTHYSHDWTGPVLGTPARDSAAYRLSSPIYHSKGLADPLLIVHGLVDDNVQFQDAARLIQKLIEERKRFEVMIYPTEPHTIQTEASRRDYVRRATEFFDQHLRGRK